MTRCIPLVVPAVLIATHFDNWTGPAVDAPPSPALTNFADEVRRCSPHTRLVIPRHFERMTL